MSAVDVSEICRRLNERAPSLAPQLLPNGRRAGNVWQFSGIDDTPGGSSAWLYLKGPNVGHWQDGGNARAGEERGDLLDLVQLRECGGDKRRAIEWAKAELGIHDEFAPGERPKMSRAEREARAAEARERAQAQEAELAAEREKKAKGARRLFLSGKLLEGTGADLYLRGRAIAPGAKWPGSLRFRADVPHKPTGRELPAMLAGIFNAAGVHIGTHRTFLEADPRRGWIKLQHEQAKMVLGNMGGGFVPINQGASGKPMSAMPEGEPVYVTEGIEDALCVRMLKPGARIVSAIALGNIGAIVLPEAARRLVIVADRDDNPKAQETLERAIARQQARGLEVGLVMPPPGIKDLNDWVRTPAAALDERKRA